MIVGRHKGGIDDFGDSERTFSRDKSIRELTWLLMSPRRPPAIVRGGFILVVDFVPMSLLAMRCSNVP